MANLLQSGGSLLNTSLTALEKGALSGLGAYGLNMIVTGGNSVPVNTPIGQIDTLMLLSGLAAIGSASEEFITPFIPQSVRTVGTFADDAITTGILPVVATNVISNASMSIPQMATAAAVTTAGAMAGKYAYSQIFKK